MPNRQPHPFRRFAAVLPAHKRRGHEGRAVCSFCGLSPRLQTAVPVWKDSFLLLPAPPFAPCGQAGPRFAAMKRRVHAAAQQREHRRQQQARAQRPRLPRGPRKHRAGRLRPVRRAAHAERPQGRAHITARGKQREHGRPRGGDAPGRKNDRARPQQADAKARKPAGQHPQQRALCKCADHVQHGGRAAAADEQPVQRHARAQRRIAAAPQRKHQREKAHAPHVARQLWQPQALFQKGRRPLGHGHLGRAAQHDGRQQRVEHAFAGQRPQRQGRGAAVFAGQRHAAEQHGAGHGRRRPQKHDPLPARGAPHRQQARGGQHHEDLPPGEKRVQHAHAAGLALLRDGQRVQNGAEQQLLQAARRGEQKHARAKARKGPPGEQ